MNRRNLVVLDIKTVLSGGYIIAHISLNTQNIDYQRELQHKRLTLSLSRFTERFELVHCGEDCTCMETVAGPFWRKLNIYGDGSYTKILSSLLSPVCL